MKIYTQLSDETKFFIKVVLALALFLGVGNYAIQHLSQSSDVSPVARENISNEVAQEADMYVGEGAGKMSIDDPSMPPIYEPVPGNDAESYEVSEYFVSLETRNREKECGKILMLKSRDDVIFENVNESMYGCNITFKVANDSVAEVLAYIEELHPRDIQENTFTIKREVGLYEDQIEILEKKLAGLDTALAEAEKNFAEVEAIARSNGDVSSLVQATESKLLTLERINASRLEVVAELDRLSKAKGDTLDTMNYVRFSINIFENEWVRGVDLKDSWVLAVQELIRDSNTFVQDLSIGFVQFVFTVVKYVLYASIVYFIVRPFVPRVRRMWREM